jgi:hypothetical protein
MEDFSTMSFCNVDVFDYDTVDGIDGHFQYNNAKFHLNSLKKFDGSCVEVYEDWLMTIWGDEGAIVEELFIMDNDEFRQKLYEKYPLK